MSEIKLAARFSRRNFLGLSAGAAVSSLLPAVLPSSLLGKEAPSERISIGCIGVGNHGVRRNLTRLLREKDARVVAVCDVFDDRRDKARVMVEKRYGTKGCAGVTDFRRILERKDIDAVMISTPDHWHVLMSALAIRAGKDVICEKPTLTVEEGRFLCKTVKHHRAVFQMATEDRSMPCYHQMAQIVRNGLIGTVKRVLVELPAGQNFPNEDAMPVPKGLDYDLWLGPAPSAPYTASRTKPQHWRHVWDYSGGKFSDWGMHQLDTVQWALDTERTGPAEIEGEGTVNAGSMYNTFVTYRLKYKYSSGVEVNVKSGGTGLRFEGTDGWVGNARFGGKVEASNPETLRWRPGEGDVKLYTNPAGEHRDFLDCIRSRKDPYFPAEIGHRCASLLHIGNIAMRLGRKVRWDPQREKFVGDPKADAMRSRTMRKPWSLEA